jgi:histidinol-phosphate aminotransferase|uniref:Histidinol-phosphate aminotransferase n=1 Tax=candidate division WOR-3 bacterium TaxID=2052148 RepID=A0A7C3UZV6_UNCW3
MLEPRKDLGRITPYRPGKPIEEVVREMRLKRVIKLASNENPLGPSPKALKALKGAFKESFLYPDDTNYYLKAKLSEVYRVGMEKIVVGNGSVELIYLAALAFLDRESEMIVSDGSFVIGKISGLVAGARVIEVPLRDYCHDLMSMLEHITPQTKVIYLDTPMNPLGTAIKREQFNYFMERLPEHVLVIVDEAYREYIIQKGYIDTFRYLRQGKNILILRTFSKIYGLAGLRVGYGFCREEIAEAINKVRYPFHINRLAQYAAIAALDDKRHIRRSIKVNEAGKRYLYRELERLKLFYLPSYANFVFVNFTSDSQVIYQRLLQEGVITRTLKEYNFPNALRVTVGTQEENEIFVAALKKVLGQP